MIRPLFLLLLSPLLAAVAMGGVTPTAESNQPVGRLAATFQASLVRVNSSNQFFDFSRPWDKKPPFARRGLGVVLEGGRILVSAELVVNHTTIELEKPISAEKIPATVERVDYEANLAVLRPADAAFLKGSRPMALDKGVKAGDSATVLQLEPNGEIAKSTATVSSINVGPYPIDNAALLIVRLSVPIQLRDNSFTIPAVRDGRLLGIVMRYDSRSQTADLIPTPVIRRFLSEVNKGEAYAGFPRVGLVFSSTRDPQLRKYLGLTDQTGGVYVTDVIHGSSGEAAGIRRGDVILAINGKAIDSDANYDDPDFGRIMFSHLTNTVTAPGETVDVTIFRDGKTLQVPMTMKVRDRSQMVSEPYLFDRAPRYLVVGGLVFQELSRPYLQEWGNDWMKRAPQRLVFRDATQDDLPKDAGKVVFISQVLPSEDTLGYENISNVIVSRFNGREIKSLEDVKAAAAQPVEGFHRIELEEDPKFLFLDAASVERNAPRLQQAYAIPSLTHL